MAHATCVPTPAIELLLQQFEPDAPQVPEGSAEIPLRWGDLLDGSGALAVLLAKSLLLLRRCR